MKKLFALLLVTSMVIFGTVNNTHAQQPGDEPSTELEEVDSAAKAEADSIAAAKAEADRVAEEEAAAAQAAEDALAEAEANKSFTQIVKEKFIEGGWEFMSLVLICLIIGLAVAIERIITLSLATVNASKLLKNVEDSLQSGGVESAIEVCRSTRGPVASIFTQGLMRLDEGLDMVEKSIVSYGGVEMGKLEKGLVWISLFIALAPMLGFMGTVIGMIGAFDSIQAAGDISPTIVAGNIKVALLTTVGGLIVAIILQIFYNYCVSKIDSIVNQMEESSIALIDILVKHNVENKA